MKLTNISQVEDFIAAVNRAHSNVWLVSPQGDRYNMKSALSQYIALGALLGQHGDELELFCDSKQDEGLFIEFFVKIVYIRMWRSLVSRLIWDQDAAGSNPVIRTIRVLLKV